MLAALPCRRPRVHLHRLSQFVVTSATGLPKGNLARRIVAWRACHLSFGESISPCPLDLPRDWSLMPRASGRCDSQDETARSRPGVFGGFESTVRLSPGPFPISLRRPPTSPPGVVACGLDRVSLSLTDQHFGPVWKPDGAKVREDSESGSDYFGAEPAPADFSDSRSCFSNSAYSDFTGSCLTSILASLNF